MVLGLLGLFTLSHAQAREYLDQNATIKSLKVSKFNNMGIEIQISLTPGQKLQGQNCILTAIGRDEHRATAHSGTGYGLVHHGVPAGSVDPVIQWSLTARSWFTNPHVIILRCNTPRDFSLTLGEIEKDLSQAIRFYKP